MKNKYPLLKLLIAMLALNLNVFSQSSYLSSNYAAAGDTMHITIAQTNTDDFNKSGSNYNWNYSALKGISQQDVIFRPPNQTGFTTLQWKYVNNTSNVNLSTTNGESIEVGALMYSNSNDYFFINQNSIEQRASSYDVSLMGIPMSVKNVFTTPDVLYKFPLNYNNQDSSVSSYTTNVSSNYYRENYTKRVNKINGWGSVTTPYGTFSNALKITTYITQIDSIAVMKQGHKDTLYFREYKWLDPSQKYPVLYVKQTRANGTYSNTIIQYLDKKIYYKPTPLFAFLPLAPNTGDTVYFQNASLNTSSVKWNFGDPASGADNESTSKSPIHIFKTAGTYSVTLYAYNGSYTESLTLPVEVKDVSTSISEVTNNKITVFPNPSSNTISIEFANSTSHFNIIDVLGNIVFEENTTTKNIVLDVSQFKDGVYFINTCGQTQKFIVQH